MNPSKDAGDRQALGALTRRFKTATNLFTQATAPMRDTVEIVSGPPATDTRLPLRYQLKDDTDGPYLACVESSNIRVRIKRGASVPASSARKRAPGTIFLDGAAQGEPFIDAAKGLYNLDHHEGCVRSFTLATCEQAMVLILKGLDLAGERWSVHANEPDFDTVLAIWLLANHRRLSANDDLRRRMMPLVRLQGAIDAHGLELAELTGYPQSLQSETLATINRLREHELELKKLGKWSDVDFLDFTASTLQEIDELVYSPSDFDDLHQVEELARAWIAPQRFAIACRSESGIYEVEEHLKEVHGDRLGLVILAKDDRTYTLRQSDPFLSISLDSLYDRLNLLDPVVDNHNRWGGSADIGGSPRATGTRLSLDEIMAICRWVSKPPTLGKRLGVLVSGLGLTAAVLATAILATGGSVFGAMAAPHPQAYGTGTLVLLGLSAALAWLGRMRFPGHFGLRLPRGFGFLVMIPVTAAAAGAGAGWAPIYLALGGAVFSTIGWWFAGALLAGVVGIELLLRSALHGLLTTVYPIMLWNGRWFVSVPNMVSSVVYTTAVVLCFGQPPWLGDGPVAAIAWVAAILVMGLACGAIRERSGSVWAPVIVHALSVATAWVLLPLMFRP